MSHFDEMTCLLYLEGQIEPPRAREITAHLSGCEVCRSLLHTLERESQILGMALTEQEESIPARILAVPASRVVSWAWAFGLGMFVACAYLLWVETLSPWLAQIGNVGFGSADLASTILFSGAFWEGWGDMFDFMQIVALVLVLITLFGLLRRHVRRSTSIAVIVSALLMAVALPQPAAAADVRRGQYAFVPSGETVHNDLILTGRSVRIDGSVEGDVIVFTPDLIVTGHVTGDIIAFAQTIRMDGTVDGNLRVFSHTTTLEGSVGKNVTSFANTFDLTGTGKIGGGLISVDGQTTLDGKVGRDLLGISGRTDLNGSIGGQVWIRGGNLTVTSMADIRGPAVFQSREQPTVMAGAKLGSPIQVEKTQELRRSRTTGRQVIHWIVSYGAAVLAGIILVTVFPGFYRVTLREAGGIGLPIGVGVLALISGIFLFVLGVLLLFVGVGAGIASAMTYAPILYIAQVFVGAWLGNKIFGLPSEATTGTVIGRIALGLLILHVAGAIPILGVLMWLVVFLWGTGAVLLGFYRLSHIEKAMVPA